MTTPLLSGRAHVAALLEALPLLDADLVDGWGRRLADVLVGGGRLLVAGNGGSAAQAQHLTAELVGRYRDDRPALSALCLSAETSSLTAIANDYGWEQSFARQVQAHGRPGDVFLGLSTSGRSANVLAAMTAARDGGLAVWAMTGRGPSPMTELADECLAVPAPATATVQEVHQVAVHLLCAAVDLEVGADRPSSAVPSGALPGGGVPGGGVPGSSVPGSGLPGRAAGSTASAGSPAGSPQAAASPDSTPAAVRP